MMADEDEEERIKLLCQTKGFIISNFHFFGPINFWPNPISLLPSLQSQPYVKNNFVFFWSA